MPQDWSAEPFSEKGVAKFKALEVIFSNILNIAVVLAGLVLFVMLIVGGLGYLFSAGDPEKAQKAQGTLTWAIIGFVLLIASWFILRFLKEFSGVDLTKFELPSS
jgi:hypothetical protein